jgi:hypothetical protein
MCFQRTEPIAFCYRAQATVALISQKKILTYEKLKEVYISYQKLEFFTSYMAAFCPYKITDRKIIKVEHNIIDSSRCLKRLKTKGEPKNKLSQKLL